MLVASALALGVYAIARDAEGFWRAIDQIGPGRILVALLLVLLGLLSTAEAWRWSVAAVAGTLGRATAWRVFFVTQLGKYLPGSVWTVVGQVDAAARHGLSRSRMAVGALLYIAVHVLTGSLLAAALLPWQASTAVTDFRWALLAVPLSIVALLPPVLTRVIDLGLRLIRREPLPRRLTTRDLARPAGWMLPMWAAFGGAGTVLSAPFTDLGLVPLTLAVTGAFALGWVAGLLIVPAPAGLGVRDAVLVLTLSPLLGLTAATSVAITLRVVHTGGDLLVGLVSLARGGATTTTDDG